MSNTRNDQDQSNSSATSFLVDAGPAAAVSSLTYVALGGTQTVLQLKEPITQATLEVLNTASKYIQSMKVDDLITFVKASDETLIGATTITKGQFLQVYNAICDKNKLPN